VAGPPARRPGRQTPSSAGQVEQDAGRTELGLPPSPRFRKLTGPLPGRPLAD